MQLRNNAVAVSHHATEAGSLKTFDFNFIYIYTRTQRFRAYNAILFARRCIRTRAVYNMYQVRYSAFMAGPTALECAHVYIV